MYVSRGSPWLSPAAPTRADDVEFNSDHPLAPNVVAYWVARGDVLQDMLGTVDDMIAANSGVPENTLSGPSFGNLGSTARACYADQSTAWKPTAATTIAGIFAAPPAGASGTYLFGTEDSFDGWGCYSFATGTPHFYMRIGTAWADQSVTASITREPALVGMTYDGATFAARWNAAKSTQSISGAITQSTISLDIANRGGGAAPAGNSAALCQSFLVLDRALSDAEWADLVAAPWQLLRMVPRVLGNTAATGVTVSLTGIGSTFSAGTLLPAISLPLTGSAITGGAGTVTPGIGVTASGSAVTASAGTVTPGLTLAIAGLAMTLSAGSVAYSAAFSLVGIATTGSTGTLSADVGTVAVGLTGLSIAVSPGNVRVTGGTPWVPQVARAIAIATAVGNTLPPPPRLTGDQRADIQAQGQWLATLYDQLVKVNNVFGRINDHETRIAALEASNDNLN